ncbi:MAG TPA: DUF1326 domain-containing protein [Methylomirabilota bacterium]|nr:DUF1326 domain-containing protein [Methylomirabilota bacterium]
MKSLSLFGILLLAGSIAAYAAPQASPQIYGQYLESRDADVYTGPCFANSEVNLSGHEAILAWHIQQGTWNNVPLDGLSVIAVVRASGTLGDPYENPLPAKAILIVDQGANEEQRDALEGFAQAQAGALLADVVGVEALPVSFQIGSQHSFATLTAGDQVKLSTRAVVESDMICHNEEVFYPPLASHLTHSMPVVSSESSYQGAALGINWDESGRRGSFVGFFAD